MQLETITIVQDWDKDMSVAVCFRSVRFGLIDHWDILGFFFPTKVPGTTGELKL